MNRQWILKERPTGMVGPEHFELNEAPMPVPDTSKGEALAKVLYMGFDPAQRGWLDDKPSYFPPVGIGEVMRAGTVAQVVESGNENLPVGTLVQGLHGWQEYCLITPSDFIPSTPLPPGITPAMQLSVFGGTSFTAYFGLLKVGEPKEGETVLVSGAAGAVGSVVVQIAKIKGCRVIGIDGGEENCTWLKEKCGADEVIDFRTEDVAQRVKALTPDGINIYFDNIGGETLKIAIDNMADYGRIPLCGMISGYNEETPPPGPNNLMTVVTRRVKMQGFIASDYMPDFASAGAELAGWITSGKLAWREDIYDGFENIPGTLQKLFTGRSVGKKMLRLAEPDNTLNT